MYDQVITVDQVILNYYVKYDTLNDILPRDIISNANCIHIYIDLYDVFRNLYIDGYNATTKYALVSYVMNMVAHYRRYFGRFYQRNTEIFLVYGDCTNMNHKQFIPDFGDDSFRFSLHYPTVQSTINTQLELVKILVGYIQDVYFVRRTSDFSIFVYDRIRNNPTTDPNILITKSLYSYQIPAMLGGNTFILRPRKYRGGDYSGIIPYNMILTSYYSQIRNHDVINTLKVMNSQLFSLMITMTGLRKYNLKSVCNSTQACRIITDALNRNMIINGYNTDIDYVYDSLTGINKYIDKDGFRFRFCAVDLVYQHRLYGGMPESMDNTWYINLHDPESVKEINDKYFYDNPIDVESL